MSKSSMWSRMASGVAAALFAFGQARGVSTGLIAHVTNAIDHDGEPFHKGPDDVDKTIIAAMARVALPA